MCCLFAAVWSCIVMENRNWRAHFPWRLGWILRRRHEEHCNKTHCGLFALGEATRVTGCPSCPALLRYSVFQQKVLSEISLDKDCHHVSSPWIAFSPLNLPVKPGSITSNQSGKESLLVLVKSKQLLAVLHTLFSFFFAGCKIPWNPVCTNLLHP